jgi:hypothetical protein
MRSFLFFLLFGSLLFAACHKPPVARVTLSLLGKWQVVNLRDKAVSNNVISYDDIYIGVPDDYMEFRSDNTFMYFLNGRGVIVNYMFLPGDRVEIDGDIFEIRDLTANRVTLYNRVDHWTGNYHEMTYDLKR